MATGRALEERDPFALWSFVMAALVAAIHILLEREYDTAQRGTPAPQITLQRKRVFRATTVFA
jgi:hypothetical protein